MKKKFIEQNNNVGMLDSMLAEQKDLKREIAEIKREHVRQKAQILAIQLVVKRLVMEREKEKAEWWEDDN